MSFVMMVLRSSTEVGRKGSNMMWRTELGRRSDQGGERSFRRNDFSTTERLPVTQETLGLATSLSNLKGRQ